MNLQVTYPNITMKGSFIYCWMEKMFRFYCTTLCTNGIFLMKSAFSLSISSFSRKRVNEKAGDKTQHTLFLLHPF